MLSFVIYKPSYYPPSHLTGPPDYHKVPVEKMFMFHQPRADYSIHPQITSPSDTEDSASGIVSDQPRVYRPASVTASERSLQGSLPSLSEGESTDCVLSALEHRRDVYTKYMY